MKTQNLVPFLLLVLSFACENKIEKPMVSAKSSNGQPPAAPTKGGNTVKGGNTAGRLGVDRFYTVDNHWGGAQWSWKGDFNGDGKWDIISVFGPGSTIAYVKLSGGEFGSYTSQTWATPNGTYSSVPAYNFTGDFNGDGYSDIASAIAGTVQMKLNNQSGGFTAAVWNVDNNWGVASNTLVGDYDGNGYDDIASYSGTSIYMKLSYGSGFYSYTWTNDGLWGPNGWTRAMDYNGDGLTDLVSINGGQLYVKQSRGYDIAWNGGLTFSTTNTWGSAGYTWASPSRGILPPSQWGGQLVTAIAGNIYVRTFDNNAFSWSFETISTKNWWGNDGYNWLEGFNSSADYCVVSAQSGQVYVH